MERYVNNPILTRNDIPKIAPEIIDPTSVFNPGAIKVDDQYKLILRVQNRGRETFWIMATSEDGIQFDIEDKYITLEGIEKVEGKIHHCYDPRITKIDGIYYIMFAVDFTEMCKLGLAKTVDFKKFEFVGIVSDEANRNGVLFPEKIGGKYYRFDRPNKLPIAGGPVTGSAINLSASANLLDWKDVGKVIAGRKHHWDEIIGAGPPPIKTKQGWLLIYHGIALHYAPIYQAGVLLVDLDDPSMVISRGRYNILEPREIYEVAGQVPNVVFPSGMTVDEYDAEGFAKPESMVHIYYGASDTVIGLARSTVQDLIDRCFE